MARIEAEMNRNSDKDRIRFIRQRHFHLVLKRLLAVGLLSVTGLMGADKLSKDLQGLPPSASVNTIIQFTGLPSAADLNAVNHAGGVLKHRFQRINGALFTVRAGQLNAIAANPKIAYISPDRKISSSLEFAEPTVNANIAFQY